ncbi:NACHT domain-containing protein [Pseudoalteromonas sp. Z9A5]|uniref:NACHT domain-containing protein n=1 Tax=Pseudoalteromonas sp. Z9A5 TaxID=2686355 RepID=UPI00140C13BC|nr:NACHT domain-containing protein [Pseudoalteromonas sp. Z9A5]
MISNRNKPFSGLTKLFKVFYSQLSEHEMAEFNQWIDEPLIKSVVEKIRRVEYVPTIYKKEEPNKIRDFYYPSKIVSKSSKSSGQFFNTKLLADFEADRSIIIEGTVGQGKSILLRFLFINELNTYSSFPIFIELKDINKDEDLDSVILNKINSLGFRCSIELYKKLTEIGLFSFFLDGFDEVQHESRKKLMTEISELSSIIPSNKLIVSSRPENEIQRLAGFEIYKIKPLRKPEQVSFVKKLIECEPNSFQRTTLLKNLDSLPAKLREVLETPLVLTMFSMVYRREVKIPESYSDFYKKLFDTLVSEHDGLKVGYTRPTFSGFNADELKEVIEHISFSIRKKDDFDSNKESFLSVIRECLSDSCKNTALSEKVFEDIVKNTCIIQKDNHKYKYIHDSIINYFSASFIKNQADDKSSSQFYESSSVKWKKWKDVLNFLVEIDKIRFYENLYLPGIKNLFEKSKLPNQFVFTKNSAKDLFKNFHLYEVEMYDIDDKTVVTKELGIYFESVTSFVIDRHFVYLRSVTNNQRGQVNVKKISNDFYEIICSKISAADLTRTIREKGKFTNNTSFKAWTLPLNEVLGGAELDGKFLTLINKLPLDGIKEKYHEITKVIKKKEDAKEKGKFVV